MVHDSHDPQEAPGRTHATATPGARHATAGGAPVPPRPDSAPQPRVAPLDTSTAGVAVLAPGAPSAPDSAPDTSTAGIPVIPPEEEPLDPRRIARESLAASRNRSLWWALAGVAAVCVVSRLVHGGAGALVLAALLAVSAVVRAVVPEPAPVALAVRARSLDVAILTGLAVAVGLLSRAVPLD